MRRSNTASSANIRAKASIPPQVPETFPTSFERQSGRRPNATLHGKDHISPQVPEASVTASARRSDSVSRAVSRKKASVPPASEVRPDNQAVHGQNAAVERTTSSSSDTTTDTTGVSRPAKKRKTGKEKALAIIASHNAYGRKEAPPRDREPTPEDDKVYNSIFDLASNIAELDGVIYAIACAYPACDGVNVTCANEYFSGIQGLMKHFQSVHPEDYRVELWDAAFGEVEESFVRNEECCRLREVTEEEKKGIQEQKKLPGWWVKKRAEKRKTRGDR